MSAAASVPKKNVVWNPDERRSLSQKVARALVGQEVDLIDDPEDYIWEAAYPHFQQAMRSFPAERQREIKRLSQVDWLIPLMREMYLATQGQCSKWPRTILDEPKHYPTPRVYEAPSVPDEVETKEINLYQDEMIVHRDQWLLLNESVRSIAELLKEQRKEIRALRKQLHHHVEHNREQGDALSELVLEVLPGMAGKLAPEAEGNAPAHPLPPGGCPLVVVAGLPRKQRIFIERELGDHAEFVYVNPATKEPSQIGDCDLLIGLGFCGRRWLTEARHLFGDKLIVATSGSGAVRAVEGVLRGGS